MLPSEIKAFASKVGNDAQFHGKTVHIKAPANAPSQGGTYLGYDGQFGATKENARGFDYDAEKVGDQIRTCQENGMPLEIELAY